MVTKDQRAEKKNNLISSMSFGGALESHAQGFLKCYF